MNSIQKQKELYEALKDKKIRKVNLYGPSGVGKTWMAKRISALSSRPTKNQLFDITLWAFMSKEYDQDILSESIGRQLGLVPTTIEWEAVDEIEGVKLIPQDEEPETLAQKIRKELKDKQVLLVIDDIMDDIKDAKINWSANEDKFHSAWKELFPPGCVVDLKTLIITRSSRGDQDISTVEVKALSPAEYEALLIEKVDAEWRRSVRIQALVEKFIKKSDGYPGTATMIAKVLNYFGEDASGVLMLEKELEEASEKYDVKKLLCRKHDVLAIGVLKDLWWSGRHFFRDSGSVNYNELITYWILEGYLGSDQSLTKLYEKGHHILMELMDCGILKDQESGYLFMNKSLLNDDVRNQCLDKIPSLGLATVFTNDTERFGKVAHSDGMLKTPRGALVEFLEVEKELQILALFNPTFQSLPTPLESMNRLRVLVLRGCAFLDDIYLRLRNLEDNNLPLPFKDLCVLEISGARSLKEMKDEFFNDMPLKSLNLSELQITLLPRSIYDLEQLQWLVIKDCPNLKYVSKLAKLKHLLVLDLSGNISLDYVEKNFLNFEELKSLNLSNTMISTTPLFRNIKEVAHLLFRDCKNLSRIRSLTSLTKLQTLDLSGCSNFEEFHDPSLEKLVSLETLNLSGTSVERLPLNIANPRFLYLKSCLQLKQLSCIDSLVRIEVLDLSGSKNLKDLEDDFFERMTCLRVLNLSETDVASLPSLSKLSDLREIYLSHCTTLKQLPSLESATNLEVLDVSKCSALEDIGNSTFEHMICLRKLDLSETKISRLPVLPNPNNLRQLLLKNCTALQNLELNSSLLNLEVLNVAGITSLASNGAEPVKDMSKLEVLDMSLTHIEQLPSMSNLKNLTHLYLAGCKRLSIVPDLDHLSKLEVLDLSGSSVRRLPKFSNSKNLLKLLLGDCLLEEDIPYVEVNDLLGPTPKLPLGISTLSNLEYLEFPNAIDIEKVESSQVELSSEEMDQDQWNICRLSENDKPPLFLSGKQFLQIPEETFLLKETFHLCTFPAMVEGETGDGYLQRSELVFADVYLQTCQFAQYQGNRSLQIRGFNHSPKGIEKIICHVNLVFLIDNKFKSMLAGLSASTLNELKGCWIERCDEMVSLFDEKEMKDDPKYRIAVEDLGIINNRHLASIYNGKQQFVSFDSLMTLYIDCCPELTTVFSSSWLTQTLIVLRIKFCDKMVSLSEVEGELPNLKTLHLWELPELKSIGVSFPSIQTLKISGATSLKSLYSGNQDFKYLETLYLENCPLLENVICSSLPLAQLKYVEIKSCEKLQTLFEHSNSVSCNLPCLTKMHLEDLPRLKSIGATLPSQAEICILECPKL
ncbi:Disease resistance protein [Artemisia annua]|uniref:Disease resistance protein n=1 Tax=Artemisia annua TaxID=35608 RepID=A0A2U1MTY9_ARTAN|nr:Disease resistance protein [Artemisia annua]